MLGSLVGVMDLSSRLDLVGRCTDTVRQALDPSVRLESEIL